MRSWPLAAKLSAAVLALALLWCAHFAWDYFDRDSTPHVAMQYQLKLFASAMYEYHSATGRWPANLDDLAITSLPQRNRLWKQAADSIVLLWPRHLKPDSKDNGHILLAYYTGGLYNKLGRKWVCWGDLRTEHMRDRDLQLLLHQSNLE